MLEQTKRYLQRRCLENCGHCANENCICQIALCNNEIEQALLELKSIKETDPTEALKQVTYLSAILPDWQRVNNGVDSLSVIKQALLKAQKQEKELEKYKKVWEIVKEKPQAELSLIQLRKIKTYEEYLSYTDLWDLDEYGDLVYTEEEFKLIKEVL